MPAAVAPLIPARVETTREELRARLRAGAASRRQKRLGEVVIHETADPAAGARVIGRLPEVIAALSADSH